MARTRNTFSYLNEEEIKKSFEIQKNAMAPYILPIYVMLDLSGSMEAICDKAIYILECLTKEFTEDIKCPCSAFLILSVIYDCRQKTDMPKIVYSGFIDEFDFSSFKKQIKECYGLTPLVNSLKQVREYGKMLMSSLDGMWHNCPVNIFITDYIENVSNDEECYTVIHEIEDEIAAEKSLAIEFILTESQAMNMNVQLENSVSFGGFRCRYDENEIKKIIESLKLSSSTIENNGVCAPPRDHIEEYNDHLRRTLITKMHEYWDKQDD